MLKIKKQKGFTLVELMIALAINLLLFGALAVVFLANINHYRKSLAMVQLYQQLQAVLDLMTNEIRRAGYWSNARNDLGLGTNSNPFMATGIDISVPSSTCILFAYDKDLTGVLPAISAAIDDERYGFRLSSQAVQARLPGSVFSCSAAANTWENLTDPNIIQITALSFTLNTLTLTTGPGTQGIISRSVDISITGRLTNDTTITRTLTSHVRVQNDKFIP